MLGKRNRKHCITGAPGWKRSKATALRLPFLLFWMMAGFVVPSFYAAQQALSGGMPRTAGDPLPAAAAGSRAGLTPQERQWLQAHDRRIRIGITVIPPQVLRIEGRFRGLAVDYIRLMEHKLGCTFKLVPFPKWNDVIQAARERRIDMIFAAQETPERQGYLRFTEEEKLAVNRRWIIVGEKSVFASRALWISVLVGLSVVTLVVAAVIVWNRMLRSIVRHRTSQLEQQLAERRQVEDALRRSEEKYRRIVDTASEGIWVLGPDHRTTFANARMAEMLGFSVEELIGRPVTDFMLEEDLPDHLRKLEDRRKGLSESYERRFRRRDGGIVWTLASATPIIDESRRFQGSFGMFTDITSRQHAETLLNEQLYFLQQLLDSVPIPIFYKDSNLLYLGCNAAFEASTCLARKDIIGKNTHEVVPKERADIHHVADLALLSQPGVQTYEVSGIYKDGKHHDVIFKKSTFFDADGRVAGIVGTQMDITELKRAELERLANLRFFECMDRINRAIQRVGDLEAMMRDLLDIVLDIFDCDRAFLLYPCDPGSPTWQIPMERNKPEYPGVLDLGLEMPMDPQVAETLRILLAAEGPVAFGPGTPHTLPEEVSRQFGFKSFLSMVIYPKSGSPWQFGIHQCTRDRIWSVEEQRIFQEIGRRLADGLGAMLAYRQLRSSLEKLEQAQRIAHIGSWELDLIHGALTWSDEACRIFEKDPDMLEVSFRTFLEKVHPDDRQAVESAYSNAIKTSRSFAVDHRLLFPDGRVKYVHEQFETDAAGDRAIRLMGTVQDISERKMLEAQLRQSQKMEAVGQLAGGVAHDFNNMLGVIIGHAELALGMADIDESLRNNFEEILEAARRSAEVTRQLLGFARKQTIEPRILDLNETVEGILKLLRRLIGEDIDLVWLPGSELWPVKMDPTQIDQILANLCVNARDAINGVGQITIKTRNTEFDDAFCRENIWFQPGAYVVLTVGDTGSGMDKPTMDKIFEPFFTTKDVGKGTGMGLATVYGIVDQNAGFIHVASKPGHGSTFRVYLPRHAAMADKASEAGPEPADLRGHETILVVEDETSHLKMVELMLERYGYHVLTASAPSEALLLAKRNSGAIHLLLTDLIMPEMSGRELAREVAMLCPDTACLFMSGHTGETIAHHGILEQGIHFIHKPFSKQALAAKVREVLDT
jgi:two-component system cell cycle sensor histidine kinase/response regulator CckA